MSEIQKVGLKLDADCLLHSDLLIDVGEQIVHDRYPFLIYATEFWFQHAEFVERGNISQDDLLLYFVFNSESPTSLFISWLNTSKGLLIDSDDYDILLPDLTPLASSLVDYACKHGLLSVLNGMLSQGVRMNFFRDHGITLLFRAIRGGQEAVVRWLLSRDGVSADLSQSGVDKALSLSTAAMLGHEAILRILLQQDDMTISGSSVRYNPLFYAAECGHESIVRLLLQRDNEAADSRSSNRNKALFRAAGGGHESVVKLLLEQDDVTADFRTRDNSTPLAEAAHYGQEGVVKLLLERDDVTVNTKASDRHKSTPLSLAAVNGHVAVLKMLLEVDEVKADKDEIDRAHSKVMFDGVGLRSQEEIMKLLDEVLEQSPEKDGDGPIE